MRNKARRRVGELFTGHKQVMEWGKGTEKQGKRKQSDDSVGLLTATCVLHCFAMTLALYIVSARMGPRL